MTKETGGQLITTISISQKAVEENPGHARRIAANQLYKALEKICDRPSDADFEILIIKTKNDG